MSITDIFVLQHLTRWHAYNKGGYTTLDLAKQRLKTEMKLLMSETGADVSIIIKTPENTQPWNWPKVVYAVDLNQFTAEAGNVPDWFIIEKFSLNDG